MTSLGEEWRPVPGWPGYDASNHGKIRSWKNGKWGLRGSPRTLRQTTDKNGHKRVSLHNGSTRRTCLVHRLVADAFGLIGGRLVRHLNGDPSDNRLENLAPGTQVDNQEDARLHGTLAVGSRSGMAKLTESDIPEIHRLYAAGLLQREIAGRMGVCRSNISIILTGRKWKHAQPDQA